MQTLEFEWTPVRKMMNRRDRVCVVHRERGIERCAMVEQTPRAGQIRHIGVFRFARVDRIAGVAIPSCAARLTSESQALRALDQAHAKTPAGFLRSFSEPVDHEGRAFLIRLHCEAITLPAFE